MIPLTIKPLHGEKSFLTPCGDQSQAHKQKDHYCWQIFMRIGEASNTTVSYKLS